jgi:hypothetical protein
VPVPPAIQSVHAPSDAKPVKLKAGLDAIAVRERHPGRHVEIVAQW